MKILKTVLTLLFGVLMVAAGVVHFLKPEGYLGFIPDYFPQKAIVYASGLVEIVAGGCTLIPRYRYTGTRLILWLMVAFLPLHILDAFAAKPVIGSHEIALIRLPLQFVLIAWAWFINKK